MKLHDIDSLLKSSLSEKRYKHSINVMHEAAILAGYHGVDERKARLAGLLHDCAREIPTKDIAEIAKKKGVELSEIEIEQPVLIHAALGMVIAQEKYDVQDEEVLRAIYEHTTGGKNMSDLSMVVFLADLTEQDRTQKGVERIRLLSRKNLLEAMLEALNTNIKFLLHSRKIIHPVCIDCWNDLIIRYNRET